MKTDRI